LTAFRDNTDVVVGDEEDDWLAAELVADMEVARAA
jgi:hypothetical protein